MVVMTLVEGLIRSWRAGGTCRKAAAGTVTLVAPLVARMEPS